MPESKFADVQGLRMHYLEWGDPANPDLLLIHGWTGLGVAWTSIAEAFQDRYHIIAPDNRGHGQTDKPVTGYMLRDFATDIVSLIDVLGLDKPAFVGHSWGGNIGTIMASDYADKICCAFLEDPVYWKMVNTHVTSLPQALARHNRPEADIRAEAAAQGMSQQEADDLVYRHHHFSPHAVTRLLTDNRSWAFRCEDHMRRIAVPTQVLVADIKAGGYMMPEELEYYRSIATPDLNFRLWEDVGHGMHAARPDQFNTELGEFLSTTNCAT